MRSKSLEFALPLLALFSPWVAHADAVTEEPGEKFMGQCFASRQEATRAVFGEAGLDDENITVRPVQTLTDGSVWMVDRTPGSNYAWFLLQPNEERQLCLTLYVPMASSVDIKRSGATQTATAKTQASPGYPMKQATYQRRKGGRIFSFNPTSCLKITVKEDGKSLRQKVPCSNRFYYDD